MSNAARSVYMAGVSEPSRPEFSQKLQTECPRCDGDGIEALPVNNPASGQEWFRCRTCDHMWSLRRDRTEQGDPHGLSSQVA